jgi:O-antigen/teichoic acid export membrane protein
MAGFLTLAGTLFVLFAPYYYVTNILIPNDVQPFPQAKGIWGFAWEALQIAWFLFDAGTYVAFVKYFAEYRIKDPHEAVYSAQFFVWWQILTGLVQVTMASVVVVFVMPNVEVVRPYGYTSTFILLVVLGQYPGIFAVMNFFFQAYQRYDYNIGLDLLSDWVLRFGLQIPFVLLFRSWGAANPEYGEAFGAAVGIGLGFYFSQVVTFLIGTALYKRLGLKLAPLFMAHFGLATAKRMLIYGLQVVLGKAFFRAAKFIDRFVISLLLLNYTEWLGLEGQIHYNLMFLFPIAYRFFETAMAALSESHGNGKQTLTQYYIARFFQVGSLYTAIALSLFLALGPMFVRHAMDPQWGRAADYMIIAAVAGAFSAAAWISDMLQKGAGRPDLFAFILGGEQALRIGLFWLLIPRFQFWGFYWALLITIALKVTIAWIINHLVIVRVRIFLWQMLVAPALAGVFNFALLRLLGTVLGFSGRWEVIVLFFFSALASFFICFFAVGLLGGMDRAFATELEQASRMTGWLRPLTRLFYYAARAGWTLSPIHNRFPITLHEQAMEEAKALEVQRDRPS